MFDLMIIADQQQLLYREVYGNVSKTSKALFYLLAAAALACFAYGVYRRVRLWRLGTDSPQRRLFTRNLMSACRDIFLQRRMRSRPSASLAHRMLFVGFAVLFVGTLLIALEHILADLLGREPTNPLFHKGLYYAVYEVTLDLFGLAMLAGCGWFLVRRCKADSSIGRQPSDQIVLVSLLVIGLTGYVAEGLRIILAATPLPGLSFVGYGFAQLFAAIGVTQASASQLHVFVWWGHAVFALALIAAFPYCRLLHSLAGAVNLTVEAKPLGSLQLVTMEELEETGRVGVGSIEHFSRWQLVQLDACVSCGRCEDACPAFDAGKPLSPRNVVQDLRSHLEFVGPGMLSDGEDANTPDGPLSQLHGGTISADTLWSCTTCGACTDTCPLGVSPLGLITDMRRHLIGEGQLRGAPATTLQKSQRSRNPWGLPPSDRFAWAEGLNVPTVAENLEFEYLYWVGCAAAYDRRIQKVARSVVKLLSAAGVSYAVLGSEEGCTGESARRMGDEFLFQELAAQNVETLAKHNVRKIVAHCPHCVNSFLHDYPQMGGNYEVVHHSQLLAELVEQGRLVPNGALSADNVVFHDPCYLARANNITESPRQVIASCCGSNCSSQQLSELPRNRQQTSCCGGGGGRMWFDDAPSERSGKGRVLEILATGAETVAVSCPFCMVMLTDGIAAQADDRQVEVRDVAELLAEAVEPINEVTPTI